ncbi:MerR family transcriptional regulator [Rhodococcoides fascians]|uniref:MerR family transcriptional regulator n=1 Tax=Rhodococcoides fascians TaxID=1828 RepID=UPI0020CB8816|nr:MULTISPECIES: MerR family transcriptional regulator [Rhodococcus]
MGELGRITGVSARSLRYYEQQGLLTSVRTPAGQRVYAPETIARVGLIRTLLAAGLTSRSIAVLITCEDTGVVTPEMVRVVENEYARVEHQMDELGQARTRLVALLKQMDIA